MGPNEGAKVRYNVQPRVERAVYINNNYNYNFIPDNVADKKNYSITNLGVASPSAQFAVYIPPLRRRYSQLQCRA